MKADLPARISLDRNDRPERQERLEQRPEPVQSIIEQPPEPKASPEPEVVTTVVAVSSSDGNKKEVVKRPAESPPENVTDAKKACVVEEPLADDLSEISDDADEILNRDEVILPLF